MNKARFRWEGSLSPESLQGPRMMPSTGIQAWLPCTVPPSVCEAAVFTTPRTPVSGIVVSLNTPSPSHCMSVTLTQSQNGHPCRAKLHQVHMSSGSVVCSGGREAVIKPGLSLTMCGTYSPWCPRAGRKIVWISLVSSHSNIPMFCAPPDCLQQRAGGSLLLGDGS